MRLFSLLAIFTSILFVNGCGLLPSGQQVIPNREVQASKLLRTGRPFEAAKLYQHLAKSLPSEQDRYHLLAAKSLLKSGSNNEARKQLKMVNQANLPASLGNQFHLLKTQIDLSFGDAEKALQHLDRVSYRQLNTNEKKVYHQSRAFAYSLTGQLLKSARERISLSRYLDDLQRLYGNYSAILETLSLLSDDTLQSAQQQSPGVLGGWIALAAIIKSQYRDAENFQLKLNNWRQAYSSHPANSNYLTTFLTANHRTFKQPQAIAVLLPESGPFANAAKAVRTGFEAAGRVDNQAAKPRIRFYDSESTAPSVLYQQALKEGAELIIGPLHKKNILQLVENIPLSIPVLALNHIDGLNKNNLYQFALSPIDEVEQTTRKALSDGHNKALILVPDSKLGQRVTAYYTQSWQELGGIVLQTQTYDPKQNDFSVPIKQLLNLNESENRYKRVRRLIPGIKFTPRRRNDADVIFISASANTARLLNPQLHFFRAKDIAVYATAQVYANRPNPTKDIDLNGITFCDMPWLFDDSYLGDLSITALQQTGLQFPSSQLKLIALGIDAYNIVAHLNDLNNTPYAGATGKLMMTADYRIKRNLLCAKFTEGYAQPPGFAINTNATGNITPDHANNNPFHVQ